MKQCDGGEVLLRTRVRREHSEEGEGGERSRENMTHVPAAHMQAAIGRPISDLLVHAILPSIPIFLVRYSHPPHSMALPSMPELHQGEADPSRKKDMQEGGDRVEEREKGEGREEGEEGKAYVLVVVFAVPVGKDCACLP